MERSMMWRTRSLESSSSRSNGPKLALSAGIVKLLSQVPFAYAKKSSPGLTLRSRALRSRPNAPISAFGAGATLAAATAAVVAGTDTGFFSSGGFEAQAAHTARAATQHNRRIVLVPSNEAAGAPETAACALAGHPQGSS